MGDVRGIYGNNSNKCREYVYIDIFTVETKLTYNNLSIGYEHMCQHPVANYKRLTRGEYGGYNTFYITVSNK
jgi:hypothetical protein